MKQINLTYQCQDKVYRLDWDEQLKQDMVLIAESSQQKKECKNAAALLELLNILSRPETFKFLQAGDVRSVMNFNPTTENENQIFKLYPNPTESFVNIQTDKIYENLKITVYDITGKQALYYSTSDSDYYLMDITSLESGIYLVKVELNDEKSEIQKLVIE